MARIPSCGDSLAQIPGCGDSGEPGSPRITVSRYLRRWENSDGANPELRGFPWRGSRVAGILGRKPSCGDSGAEACRIAPLRLAQGGYSPQGQRRISSRSRGARLLDTGISRNRSRPAPSPSGAVHGGACCSGRDCGWRLLCRLSARGCVRVNSVEDGFTGACLPWSPTEGEAPLRSVGVFPAVGYRRGTPRAVAICRVMGGWYADDVG